MEITAALVKELRERTGSGMMECKKALVEANGDIDTAVEAMRKSGLAKADKKAGRVAAEGCVVIQLGDDATQGAMVEVNCETDFVGKGDDFVGFAGHVAKQALAGKPADLDALMSLPLEKGGDKSINTTRQEMIAKIGENISVRRFVTMAASGGVVGSYLHGGRIGVLVELQGGNAALAKDIAMHVAASKPVCVSPDEVPADIVEKEKDIFRAQAAESGKPANIIEKMITGRIQKFLAEITLVGQPFVKNPDVTVEKLLQDANAKVVRFQRFEVGEGIEKKQEDFAAEVMAQVRGS
ncbi:MAG: elongation factor Ts [Gammaproteobacteria bacterium]|nr:elongation factor Ts [Gammaproteobacteria bacterium]